MSTTRSPKTKRIIRGIAFLAVLIVVVMVVARLNAPSKGVINQHPTLAKKSKVVEPQNSPITEQTSYYVLNLPAGFANIPSGSPPSGILAVQTFSKQLAIGKLVFSIAVKPMPDGGLTSDSAYQLRQAFPNRYSFTTKQVHGDTVTIANDSQSAGVIAFWPHNNLLATISASMGFDGPPADGNADELEQLQILLQSWQWR